MMKRKWTAVLLAGLLAVMTTGCSTSNQAYYEQAQLYLGQGSYEMAAMLFSQLGEYEQAADYALYSAALQAIADGNFALARANLELVFPFKSSDRYLSYLEALELEYAGELQAALNLFEELGSFENSAEHAAALRGAIPAEEIARAQALMDAGRYEQALGLLQALTENADIADMLADCEDAILRAAYDRAEALYAGGQYSEAMSAFEALGDNLDAAQRALDCRAAMYEALEESFQSVTMATAPGLMAGYAEMEDYGESEDRLTVLEARFGKNLSMAETAASWPWVSFGQYPVQETGAPAPLTWRLLHVDGATATLLCDSVIDALPATTLPSLMLSADEQAAVISLSLPLLSDLTGFSADDLRCTATAYAMAQGVRRHTDGSAWWWLGNAIDAGRNAIVWYNGNIIDTGVAATETVVGMRPLLRIDLDDLTFTEGSGAIEDPFR